MRLRLALPGRSLSPNLGFDQYQASPGYPYHLVGQSDLIGSRGLAGVIVKCVRKASGGDGLAIRGKSPVWTTRPGRPGPDGRSQPVRLAAGLDRSP